MNLEQLKAKMDEVHYIYDDTLATVLTVALQLGRPLLIEGAAGVGKTDVQPVGVACNFLVLAEEYPGAIASNDAFFSDVIFHHLESLKVKQSVINLARSAESNHLYVCQNHLLCVLV